MAAVVLGVVGTAFLFNALTNDNKSARPNMGTYPGDSKKASTSSVKKYVGSNGNTVASNVTEGDYASVEGIQGRQPFQSCIEQQGAWLSSNLLPKDTSNVTDDWNVNTPGNLEDKNFLEAGHHFGVDTVGSSHKNANWQLRSEPIIPREKISPFLNSSIMPDDHRRRFDIEQF